MLKPTNLWLLLISSALLLAAACQKKPEPNAAAPASSQPPTVSVTTVTQYEGSRILRLPGEIQPYQDVQLFPKVQGFIAWMGVDRGSQVQAGQELARLAAPEFAAQTGEAEARTKVSSAQKIEAESRIAGVRAQRLEAEARLAASSATYARLKAAAATPGVIAGNELENALRSMEADQARVQFFKESEKSLLAQVSAFAEGEKAARAAVKSVQVNQNYLRITAPFAGVITDRYAHPGALAGTAQPVLRLQQISRLRLIVAVPEAEIAGVNKGTRVEFTVPAFPGEMFAGVIARIGKAVDPKTRTMAVELDVNNAKNQLAPGMFPQLNWPTSRPQPSLIVPITALATTTERTFVIRIKDNQTEWIDVKRGIAINQAGKDFVEVFGALEPGDTIAVRGTDELRAGTPVTTKAVPK